MKHILNPLIASLGSHADLRRSKPMFPPIREPETGFCHPGMADSMEGGWRARQRQNKCLGTFEERNRKEKKECGSYPKASLSISPIVQSEFTPKADSRSDGFVKSPTLPLASDATPESSFWCHGKKPNGLIGFSKDKYFIQRLSHWGWWCLGSAGYLQPDGKFKAIAHYFPEWREIDALLFPKEHG